MKRTYQQPTVSVISPLTEHHLLAGSNDISGSTSTSQETNSGHADSNTNYIWETDEETTEDIWGNKH